MVWICIAFHDWVWAQCGRYCTIVLGFCCVLLLYWSCTCYALELNDNDLTMTWCQRWDPSPSKWVTDYSTQDSNDGIIPDRSARTVAKMKPMIWKILPSIRIWQLNTEKPSQCNCVRNGRQSRWHFVLDGFLWWREEITKQSRQSLKRIS